MVFVFLANGFEEIEAVTPIDILRRCNIPVTVVSIYDVKSVTGAHGIEVKADITIDEVEYDSAKMFILPGGSLGVENLGNCGPLKEMLSKAEKDGKFIAAICAAPTLLGKLALLNDRKATCYPSLLNELIAKKSVKESVVEDGNIITSMGAGTSADFGFALAKKLGYEKEAQALAASMCYKI